ncbi:MAG: zinc-binding dehydrogenase, partial [Geminicoccaceae bacterium]|nr:zinc-binding dehydrogenase [Geminicoccaceae bacterium]
TGAFAEEVVVHASQAVVIPPDMPYDVASLIACGVLTGFGAVTNTAGVRRGESVAVIGTGGVGINTLQAARHVGASPVIAIDLSEDKLAAAPGFGATHTVNPARRDAQAAVLELTQDRGVHYAFVTVGAKKAIEQAAGLVRKGGAIVIVGMPASGVTVDLDPTTLAACGQRVLGSKMGSARIAVDIPYLVGLYRQGRLELDALVSGRYPLAGINDAIASSRRGRALRNVIVF